MALPGLQKEGVNSDVVSNHFVFFLRFPFSISALESPQPGREDPSLRSKVKKVDSEQKRQRVARDVADKTSYLRARLGWQIDYVSAVFYCSLLYKTAF